MISAEIFIDEILTYIITSKLIFVRHTGPYRMIINVSLPNLIASVLPHVIKQYMQNNRFVYITRRLVQITLNLNILPAEGEDCFALKLMKVAVEAVWPVFFCPCRRNRLCKPTSSA